MSAKWYENYARTFVFERQDESFNERDTPMLANGAEVRCDPLAITPILEHATFWGLMAMHPTEVSLL